MNFHVVTTFPDLVRSVFEHGVVRRAVEAGRLGYSLTDPRDFTEDRHRTTDDMPYGGGPGMVMLAEPLFRAVSHLRGLHGAAVPLIYLSPAGRPLTQSLAEELAGPGTKAKGQGLRESRREQYAQEPELTEEKQTDTGDDLAGAGKHLVASKEGLEPGRSNPVSCTLALDPCPSLILLCGRYEGVDQRALDELGALEVSIGDYVLSGGELAAMVLIDVVARLLPGVLGNQESSSLESFAGRPDGTRMLDWPHYTRPEIWRGRRVPEVLLSGNHAKILGFREDAALVLTFQRRPDLLTPELRQRAERLLEAQSGQPGQG